MRLTSSRPRGFDARWTLGLIPAADLHSIYLSIVQYEAPGSAPSRASHALIIRNYMPMFISVVITFPEFVAVLSVRESSSSPALAEQTLGVLSILDFSPLEVAPTLLVRRRSRDLLHFLVTEPAIVGGYPTTALPGSFPPVSGLSTPSHGLSLVASCPFTAVTGCPDV